MEQLLSEVSDQFLKDSNLWQVKTVLQKLSGYEIKNATLLSDIHMQCDYTACLITVYIHCNYIQLYTGLYECTGHWHSTPCILI